VSSVMHLKVKTSGYLQRISEQALVVIAEMANGTTTAA
jgi:hypothetical protein